ncbi:MAG: leucyl aminopeptidase [Betaproteobacteria bacterium]|nr:leucyl aminopeptidase [Betaproteobacteria bacterium]
MNFDFQSQDLAAAAQEKCDALLVLVPDGARVGRSPLDGLVAQAIKDGDLDTKGAKPLSAYRSGQVKADRLVLVGIAGGSAAQVRAAVASAMALVKSPKLKRLVVAFAAPAQEAALRAAVVAVADSSYVFTHTKSKPASRTITAVRLCAPESTVFAVQGRTDIQRRVEATVAGMELAKEWANRPANHATPTLLAKAARDLVKAAGSSRFSCEVLGPAQVAKLGMGAFMAVAQGSSEPLRFIVLRYNGAAKTAAPTVLVGKGITFDSGGISIKPSAEMDEMKFDMCGAASVLGTFKALTLLKPKINVVGLIPSCENLINGQAVKPGDVVTSMAGQTIEILNTDAEGRLILCDALTYAERFKPSAVVDVATLTGACVVALGSIRSGLFSPDDGLATSLLDASERAQDPVWRMPLDEEYAEGLKSNFADVANIAGRMAGSVTAAKFLQRFTEKFAWAHLDIAGTAWKSGPQKGATGRPVPTLVEFVCSRSESP